MLNTPDSTPAASIYTVGHSNQSAEEFLQLLRRHEIKVVVDVRSAPYSRWAPQFNQREIRHSLTAAGLHYLYLGKELGGRPASAELYDAEGHARYDLMAQTAAFRSGIERVLSGIQKYRVALMCSEENPQDCHRRLLVGRVLLDHGVALLHLRADGSIQQEDASSLIGNATYSQPALLPDATPPAPERWRSVRPIAGHSRTDDKGL